VRPGAEVSRTADSKRGAEAAAETDSEALEWEAGLTMCLEAGSMEAESLRRP